MTNILSVRLSFGADSGLSLGGKMNAFYIVEAKDLRPAVEVVGQGHYHLIIARLEKQRK